MENVGWNATVWNATGCEARGWEARRLEGQRFGQRVGRPGGRQWEGRKLEGRRVGIGRVCLGSRWIRRFARVELLPVRP